MLVISPPVNVDDIARAMVHFLRVCCRGQTALVSHGKERMWWCCSSESGCKYGGRGNRCDAMRCDGSDVVASEEARPKCGATAKAEAQ